jgi:RNase P subunit RPR2
MGGLGRSFTCERCGVVFAAKTNRMNARYCSTNCKTAAWHERFPYGRMRAYTVDDLKRAHQRSRAKR